MRFIPTNIGWMMILIIKEEIMCVNLCRNNKKLKLKMHSYFYLRMDYLLFQKKILKFFSII